METDHITQRARTFIQLFGNSYSYFAELTGIPATRWKDMNLGRTRALPMDMLQALCDLWPEFAYWFATGKQVSPRGQTTPLEYFDLTYGAIGAVETGSVRICRDETGTLRPELGNIAIEDKQSREYEISIAYRVIFFSALTSDHDAALMAEKFWQDYLQPLTPGGPPLVMERGALKRWINQFPITQPIPFAERSPSQVFLAAPRN